MPSVAPIATAIARRRSGDRLAHGAAAFTQYAIASPSHWTETSGCQKGRGSSIQ